MHMDTTNTKGATMSVTRIPVDPGITHIDKYDVVIDSMVVGRIERSRRDWTETIANRWNDDL